MKGKLLFVCIPHFGLYEIFEQGFKEHSGCEVQTIIYKDYKYKNKTEKIINFLSKTFTGTNLKRLKGSAQNISEVSRDEMYDYVFIICPEILLEHDLKLVTSRGKKAIVYYWDGFDHFPEYIPTMKYFDVKWSFDPVDVKKYNLNFITNFYFKESRNYSPEYDLFFVGSYDSRYETIAKIVQAVEKQGKKIAVSLYTDNLNKITHKNIPSSIKMIDEYMPITMANELMQKSKIVLDIHKEIQHGLSFRVFEAMGMGKKLITTNPDIANYDFYDPQNIFIWNYETCEIPESFVNSPYRELPDNIYKKYSRENWVKTVLGLKDYDQIS